MIRANYCFQGKKEKKRRLQKKKKSLCYSRSIVILLKKYTNKSRATYKNSQISRRQIVINNLISKKVRLITCSNKN